MTTLGIRVRLGLFCRVDIPYASLRFEERFDAALLNVPPRELQKGHGITVSQLIVK